MFIYRDTEAAFGEAVGGGDSGDATTDDGNTFHHTLHQSRARLGKYLDLPSGPSLSVIIVSCYRKGSKSSVVDVIYDTSYEAEAARVDYAVNFPAAGTYTIWVRGTARMVSPIPCMLV